MSFQKICALAQTTTMYHYTEINPMNHFLEVTRAVNSQPSTDDTVNIIANFIEANLLKHRELFSRKSPEISLDSVLLRHCLKQYFNEPNIKIPDLNNIKSKYKKKGDGVALVIKFDDFNYTKACLVGCTEEGRFSRRYYVVTNSGPTLKDNYQKTLVDGKVTWNNGRKEEGTFAWFNKDNQYALYDGVVVDSNGQSCKIEHKFNTQGKFVCVTQKVASLV